MISFVIVICIACVFGKKKKITTTVVLVAKQLVIGSANEIDNLPKEDVRARSRVVLGNKCNGPHIRILDYNFHPDYKRDSYSALAIVQLDIDTARQELRPICPPPSYLVKPQIYAMVNHDCKKGRVQVHKMIYVPKEDCQHYYRKSGLGFGVDGPGCQAPARFLDYGMEQLWVRNSVARIGTPAISHLEDNHIIMRRSLGNLQRFGPCDPEEQRHLIYRDDFRIIKEKGKPWSMATYNVTLISNMEYSCIVLTATPSEDEPDLGSDKFCTPSKNPKIYLRRWCADSTKLCHGSQYLDINFFVQIKFEGSTDFSMKAYGKVVQVIDPLKSLEYANSGIPRVAPKNITYKEVLQSLIARQNDSKHHRWFYSGISDDISFEAPTTTITTTLITTTTPTTTTTRPPNTYDVGPD